VLGIMKEVGNMEFYEMLEFETIFARVYELYGKIEKEMIFSKLEDEMLKNNEDFDANELEDLVKQSLEHIENSFNR
jgi:hypothetical protein